MSKHDTRSMEGLISVIRETVYVRAICLDCLKEHTEDLSKTVCECGGIVPLVYVPQIKGKPALKFEETVVHVNDIVWRMRNDAEYLQKCRDKYAPLKEALKVFRQHPEVH